jgi:Spy/CpxP family protein refolding chaperone
MNYFDKNRILIWAVVFFLVINVSALATFFVYFSKNGKPIHEPAACQSCGQFCRMLDLTEEQSKTVEKIQAGFHVKSDPLIEQIKEVRRMMLLELSKDAPDTSLVNQYADSIGELHKQLQKTAASQFLSLKQVCNPEQCRKLSTMYYDLYGCKGEKMMEGKGKQHRFHGGN